MKQTKKKPIAFHIRFLMISHSYDVLSARMLWKPKEARILKNFNVQNEECHH
jgi:hypothetical protein